MCVCWSCDQVIKSVGQLWASLVYFGLFDVILAINYWFQIYLCTACCITYTPLCILVICFLQLSVFVYFEGFVCDSAFEGVGWLHLSTT